LSRYDRTSNELDVAVFSLLLLSLLRVRMSVHVYAADDEQVR